MIDNFSSAQPRPHHPVPSTTEWLRRKGLGRDGRPLAQNHEGKAA